jgi:Transposase
VSGLDALSREELLALVGRRVRTWPGGRSRTRQCRTTRAAFAGAALTGAEPSPGFVHGMLKRTFAALAEVDNRIRTLVTLA